MNVNFIQNNNFLMSVLCTWIGGLSIHRMHDIRIPNARQALFHTRPDEWWRSTLSSITTWRVHRTWNAFLCRGGDTWTRTHAPTVCRISWSQGVLIWRLIYGLFNTDRKLFPILFCSRRIFCWTSMVTCEYPIWV